MGGGVTFGPRSDRNFSLKVNKAQRRAALTMVLSDKVASGAFIAVDAFTFPEGKTKLAMAMRSALPGSEKKALIVLAPGEETLARAARNLPDTTTIRAGSLNVRDVAKFPTIIVSKAGVEADY